MSLFSATRPHSVGLALNDSPAGLAAYILEKFAMWSGCKTTDTAMCVESRFSKDHLLTNVMIYWATHSITSSIRLCYEDMHSASVLRVGRLVWFLCWWKLTGCDEKWERGFGTEGRRWDRGFGTRGQSWDSISGKCRALKSSNIENW